MVLALCWLFLMVLWAIVDYPAPDCRNASGFGRWLVPFAVCAIMGWTLYGNTLKGH